MNGEGSIHSNSPRARQLSAIGPRCRTLGKRCYLINATVQRNGGEIYEDMKAFDHVWVRESASASQLLHAGISHSVCADLSLLQSFPRHGPQGRGGTIVVDSVVDSALRQLAAYAVAEKTMLAVMKRSPSGDCYGARWPTLAHADFKTSMLSPLFECNDYRRFAEYIGSYDRMISGRFHSICFALVMRLPFHACHSNTHKIEATLADIGLDADRMLAPNAPLPSPKPLSSTELQAIDDFLARTRRSADEMANAILA